MDRQMNMSNKPMDRLQAGHKHMDRQDNETEGDRNRGQTQGVRQMKRSHTGPNAHGQTDRQRGNETGTDTWCHTDEHMDGQTDREEMTPKNRQRD